MAAAISALFVMTFAMVFGNTAADPDLLQDICVADFTSGTPLSTFSSSSSSSFPLLFQFLKVILLQKIIYVKEDFHFSFSPHATITS